MWSRRLGVALLLGATAAPAQFTSSFPYVTLAANFNGFDTLSPRMRLISNGVWQGYVQMTNQVNPQFLFSTPNFTNTWKEVSQPPGVLPLQGTAEFNSGSDIVLNTNFTGTLRFRFAEGNRAYSVFNVSSAGGGGGGTTPWINEFHYDHAGTDTNEFFEIAGPAGLSLNGYTLYRYNGSGGIVYGSNVLTGTIPNQSSGFGTLSFKVPTDTLQNGAPDGLVLVRSGVVVHALSYEGSLNALGGPADGLTLSDVGVSENNSTPVNESIQLTGTGNAPGSFTWVGPANASPGSPNAGQSFISLPAPALVALSNLTHTPGAPLFTNTVHIEVNATAASGASNLSATAFYATNGATRFLPVPMVLASGNLYRTATPLPAQPIGATVSYYVWCNFDGPGTNSPALLPADAPSNAPSYSVSAVPAGTVWINEVNVYGALFTGDTNELIELVGPAGTDLSLWTVECYDDVTNLYASYTLPNPTRLPSQTNGFGFFVLGDSGLAGVDLVFTNPPNADSHLWSAGAIRLRDATGATMDAIRYGLIASNFTLFSSTWAGNEEDGFVEDEYALGRMGTGGVASAFTWVVNVSTNPAASPGLVNTNQVLLGGNTNLLAPTISCPPTILLDCISAPIPTANVASVVATGLCGNGSVTITHIGDATNSGSACFGDPRIVTRTYRAVSACGTTSTCAQLIILEDKTPPSMTWPTSTLVNAGFELGDFTGWTNFGVVSNNVTVTVALPRNGFFNARITPPIVTTLYDASPQALDGLYYGGPTWNQSGKSTGTGRSVYFNVATGDFNKADVPWDESQNNTNFSFALWARCMRTNGAYRAALTARDDGPPRGYILYASQTNKWEFWTGSGTGGWHVLGGPAVATNTWVHLAGTLGTYITNGAGTNLVTNLIKRLYVDGALAASVTNVGFTPNGQRPLRIGAGSTESTPGSLPFPGFLDDVQLYGYPLEATNIQALYNSGLGGVVSTGAVGHYRLDEHFAPLSRTSGFQQAMAALSGETWQASIHLAHPSINPLMNTNLVQVDLLYLNSTGGVLSTFSAPQFDTASPRDQYIRYAARGTAPSGTVSAALRVQYRQDAGYSPGIVYADDAVLTPFAVTSGLSCAIIPDFRYVVQATDTCSAVTIIQDPSPGSVVGGSNVAVRFIAADACGLATTGGIEITIMDTTAPTAVTLPPIAVGCIDQVPPPNPGGVVATDNCGSVFVTLETNVVGATGGCGAAPKTILYRYRITDASGNFGFVNQLIQVRDSNAPVVVCVMPDLTNGTFEASTFANWSTFGTHLYLTNLQPRSGSGHAVFYGATNGLYNFTGLYQDLPAAPGQAWRAAGFALQPAGLALQGSNRVELKIEFLNSSESIIETQQATPFTSNSYQEVYVPISVNATSPAGTAKVRCTVLLAQPNTPSNAPGTVFLDDFSLTRHMVSVDPVVCQGRLPNVADLPSFLDCGTITTNQVPISGSSLNLGWNTNVVSGTDSCGFKSSCAVDIYVVDDIPPFITTAPTSMFIQVASTNAVPYPSTNALVAADNCGVVRILHAGDTNNGASGLPGDPLIITRTYRVEDTFSNAVLARQTIVVEGPLPTAPSNVVIQSMSLEGDLMVRSFGTNAWAVTAEYTTNLMGTQAWSALPPTLNYALGGTNVTFFASPPTNAHPFIIRLRQYFP